MIGKRSLQRFPMARLHFLERHDIGVDLLKHLGDSSRTLGPVVRFISFGYDSTDVKAHDGHPLRSAGVTLLHTLRGAEGGKIFRTVTAPVSAAMPEQPRTISV